MQLRDFSIKVMLNGAISTRLIGTSRIYSSSITILCHRWFRRITSTRFQIIATNCRISSAWPMLPIWFHMAICSTFRFDKTRIGRYYPITVPWAPWHLAFWFKGNLTIRLSHRHSVNSQRCANARDWQEKSSRLFHLWAVAAVLFPLQRWLFKPNSFHSYFLKSWTYYMATRYQKSLNYWTRSSSRTRWSRSISFASLSTRNW